MNIAEALAAQDRQTVIRPPWVEFPKDPVSEIRTLVPIHADRCRFIRLVGWFEDLERRWHDL